MLPVDLLAPSGALYFINLINPLFLFSDCSNFPRRPCSDSGKNNVKSLIVLYTVFLLSKDKDKDKDKDNDKDNQREETSGQ